MKSYRNWALIILALLNLNTAFAAGSNTDGEAADDAEKKAKRIYSTDAAGEPEFRGLTKELYTEPQNYQQQKGLIKSGADYPKAYRFKSDQDINSKRDANIELLRRADGDKSLRERLTPESEESDPKSIVSEEQQRAKTQLNAEIRQKGLEQKFDEDTAAGQSAIQRDRANKYDQNEPGGDYQVSKTKRQKAKLLEKIPSDRPHFDVDSAAGSSAVQKKQADRFDRAAMTWGGRGKVKPNFKDVDLSITKKKKFKVLQQLKKQPSQD